MVLLIALALVPFFAGRTTLTVGLLLALFALQTNSSWPISLMMAGAVVLSILSQWGVTSARQFIDEQMESYRWLTRQVDVIVSTLSAMIFVVYAMASTAGWGVHQVAVAGFTKESAYVGIVGLATFIFASLRSQIAELFSFVPLASEKSVQRTLFITDVLWTIVGVGVAVAAPILGVVLMGIGLVALSTGALLLARIKRSARGACESCHASIHLSASQCPKCRQARAPRHIGLFGRALGTGVTDLPKHRVALVAARRCPSCAERLAGTSRCAICAEPVFRTDADRAALAAYVDKRAIALIPVFAGLGFVPLLGLGAAVLVYRLSPASALGPYVAWHERFGTRVVKGAGMLGLTVLQPVPVIGAASTLAVIAAMHVWTRRAFTATVSTGAAETGLPVLS